MSPYGSYAGPPAFASARLISIDSSTKTSRQGRQASSIQITMGNFRPTVLVRHVQEGQKKLKMGDKTHVAEDNDPSG